MSNDRHQEIDNGSMGTLFRRLTLASLGLDAMEGVSEQSFDVIDRADAFAERLLDGVSRVMPRGDVSRLGQVASTESFWRQWYASRAMTQGPKNATDVGEWQYWLDAVLLTLFDEDEAEAEAEMLSSDMLQVQRHTEATKQAKAVRERVAALRASGVRPAMLQSLSLKDKRTILGQFSAPGSDAEKTRGGMGELGREIAARAMASSSVFEAAQALAHSPRQMLASHVMSRAGAVEQSLAQASSETSDHSRMDGLVTRWRRSVETLVVDGVLGVGALRDMHGILAELSSLGVVSSEDAAKIEASGRMYARRVLSDELTQDVLHVAERLRSSAGMVPRIEAGAMGSISQRAMVRASEPSNDNVRMAMTAFANHLETFGNAVSARVAREGESSATLRWKRAEDRFVRLHGVSDEIDRVLLRDVLDSAESLHASGVISDATMRAVTDSVRVSTSRHADATGQFKGNDRDGISVRGAMSSLVSRVEHSMTRLAARLSSAGVGQELVTSLLNEIEGIGFVDHASSGGSIGRSVSMIRQISEKLDTFVSQAIQALAMPGYDSLQSEGVYVSSSEAAEAGQHTDSLAAVLQVRDQVSRFAAQQRQSQETILSQVSALASQATQDSALSIAVKQHMLALATARNATELESAQHAAGESLSQEMHAHISAAVASIRASETKLEQLSSHVDAIEATAHLSNRLGNLVSGQSDATSFARSLRGSLESVPQRFRMDDSVILSEYLPTLTHSLAGYAALRSNFGRTGLLSRAEEYAAQGDSRLDRMLSLVKPDTSLLSDVPAHALPVSSMLAGDTSPQMGYDEIVTSMNWVRAGERQGYASEGALGDISSMLGLRKALMMHASDMASGQTQDVAGFSRALKQASLTAGLDSVAAYTMSSEGDRVKAVLSISDDRSGLSLRRAAGDSHIPVSARTSHAPLVKASLGFNEPLMSGIAGIEAFSPVMLGAGSVPGHSRISASSEDSYAAGIRRAGNDIRSTLAAASSPESGKERFQMHLSDAAIDMSAHDFVSMVARPNLESASRVVSASSVRDELYAGYVEMLSQQGEGRSLKRLRQGYLSALSSGGQNTARASVGFNTQSYVGMLGGPEAVSRTHDRSYSGSAYDASAPRFVSGQRGTASHEATFGPESSDLRETLLSTFSMPSDSSALNSQTASSPEYTWVTHGLGMHSALPGVAGEAPAEGRQVLDRIDSLLDYVENVSNRNVGVFSTNEVVRALVEALPRESYLGERGLPQWRQKDAKARQAAEARELREALQKIGANPIQGMQRADKRYVSPNLLPQAEANAPLFSGGLDGGSTPTSAATSSDSGSNVLGVGGVPTAEIKLIAEEVYQMILNSLDEEYQRCKE
ncbi:MAG: hypothetical protein FWC40_01045 [Proteobacteria bacterium]|nr:hypothetical protein [Pseudomonadota bacterium]